MMVDIPTIIKPCQYRPTMLNDWDVYIDYDPRCKNALLYLEYALVFENKRYWIGIKSLFISDGGSFPRITWTITGLTPFDPRCVYGFFIHDGLYGSHLLPQEIADRILLEIMCIKPRPNWCQRRTTYKTLRAEGHHAYNGKTDKQIETALQFVTVIDKQKLGLNLNTVII